MYRVEFAKSAKKDIEGLPERVRSRIKAKLLSIRDNPRPKGCVKLEGFGLAFFRVRVGDYRIVYHVDDKNKVITVTRVRHRKDVYR